MKLYAFDEVDERLLLLPLAARRVLDQLGLRLSRAGWQSLTAEARRTLTELGEAPAVDLASARALLERATPAAELVQAGR